MSRALSPMLRPARESASVRACPPLVAKFVQSWVTCLCFSVLGYALLGRGFAYIGVPPLFVAEILTLSGIGILCVCGPWWPLLRLPQVMGLIALFVWCTLRTIPYLSVYGMDALRDAILWGYGVLSFALAAALVTQPKLFPVIVRRYRIFFKAFLIFGPLAWIMFQYYAGSVGANATELPVGIPTWPWASDVPIIYLKAGDLQVELAGIFGFWAADIGGAISMLWFIPLLINAAMLGTTNRGGMMAFLSSIVMSLIFKPLNRWAFGFIAIAVVSLTLLFATGVEFKIPGSERPISADQLIQNIISVGSQKSGDLEELQGTKQWRLDFWNAIIKDVVYGPAFWTGHGFGVNLTVQYGFELDDTGAVRAPHNGHMSMLARAGVPGLALWAFVHLSWAAGMVDGYIRSMAAGRKRWAGVFLWLLIYWLGVMINCSFDPYIEGPVGGVLLWSIYGAGLAAIYLRTQEPTLFDPPPAPVAPIEPPDALAEMGTI